MDLLIVFGKFYVELSKSRAFKIKTIKLLGRRLCLLHHFLIYVALCKDFHLPKLLKPNLLWCCFWSSLLVYLHHHKVLTIMWSITLNWFYSMCMLDIIFIKIKFCAIYFRKPVSGYKLKEITGSGIFAPGGENGMDETDPATRTPSNPTGIRMYQVNSLTIFLYKLKMLQSTRCFLF